MIINYERSCTTIDTTLPRNFQGRSKITEKHRFVSRLVLGTTSKSLQRETSVQRSNRDTPLPIRIIDRASRTRLEKLLGREDLVLGDEYSTRCGTRVVASCAIDHRTRRRENKKKKTKQASGLSESVFSLSTELETTRVPSNVLLFVGIDTLDGGRRVREDDTARLSRRRTLSFETNAPVRSTMCFLVDSGRIRALVFRVTASFDRPRAACSEFSRTLGIPPSKISLAPIGRFLLRSSRFDRDRRCLRYCARLVFYVGTVLDDEWLSVFSFSS